MSHVQSVAEPLPTPLNEAAVPRESIAAFVEDMPARVATLRRHFDGCDWHALRVTVRHLGRGAEIHGFVDVPPLASQLEAQLTRRAPTPEVGEALEELIAQCKRVTVSSRLRAPRVESTS